MTMQNKTKPTMADIKAKINELDQMLKESGLECSALINVKNEDSMDACLLIKVDMTQGSKPSISWMRKLISIGCMMRSLELCEKPTGDDAKQAIRWFYGLRDKYPTQK